METKGMIGKLVFEDDWIEIYISDIKTRTFVFIVHSKCSDSGLGRIHWYPSWRAYTFEPETGYKIELSDRCQFAIGGFTMWINSQHKMKYKGITL